MKGMDKNHALRFAGHAQVPDEQWATGTIDISYSMLHAINLNFDFLSFEHTFFFNIFL